MNGFQGLTQSEIYAAIDYGRAEVSSASDYDINGIGYGTNWITKTYWTDTKIYGQIHAQHSGGYVVGADIKFNYNSDIMLYDGTNCREVPNMKAVAVHELFHGADMKHVYQSGSTMFFSYDYHDWIRLSSDGRDKLVEIYGSA